MYKIFKRNSRRLCRLLSLEKLSLCILEELTIPFDRAHQVLLGTVSWLNPGLFSSAFNPREDDELEEVELGCSAYFSLVAHMKKMTDETEFMYVGQPLALKSFAERKNVKQLNRVMNINVRIVSIL